MNHITTRARKYPNIVLILITFMNSMTGELSVPPVAAYTPKKSIKQTIPVPSLSSDSASTSVEKRLLVFNSCSSATTATGSVALIKAPNIRANAHVQFSYPGIVSPITTISTPVSIMQITRPGAASRVAFAKVFLNMCIFSSYAASNIRIGRKRYSIRSGFMSATLSTASDI